MHPARIAELLAPFLSSQPADNDPLYQHISTYIDILLRWNTRINLTAIRHPEEVVTRHFGESLFAARILFPNRGKTITHEALDATRSDSYQGTASSLEPALSDPEYNDGESKGAESAGAENGALAPEGPPTNRVADLGSGAGFPGIPIKLWAPHIALTLIESSQKKSTFLREVARALTLTDINILTTRAENLAPTHLFDVVTLRAVERFEHILPIAGSLVAPGGRLAILIGTAQLTQARSSLADFTWQQPVPMPQSRTRTLLIAVRLDHR